MGYEIDVENRQNLNLLKEKPKEPFVIYFNHAAMDDPFLVVSLLNSHARERLGNVVMPVSEDYVQFQTFPAYSFFVNIGRNAAGFSMPEVVQSYRIRREGVNTEVKEKSVNLATEFIRLIKRKLPSGPVVIISPEGHRSKNGVLIPAEAGVGAIAHLIKRLKEKAELLNGYFIPIGLAFDRWKGPLLHYNLIEKARIKAVVGEPMDVETVISESMKLGGDAKPDSELTSHFLMYRLAQILPEEMRGVYHRRFIKDTLRGRFKLHRSKEGVDYIYDKKEQKLLEKISD